MGYRQVTLNGAIKKKTKKKNCLLGKPEGKSDSFIRT